MKLTAYKLVFLIVVLAAQLCLAQVPAGAPAGSTGLCKDGTYYSGASKQGACKGHKGIKEWYGATSAPGKSATAPTKPAPGPTKSTDASSQKKVATAPTDATGICNDGTYTTGTTKQGACRGHKGIKEWFSKTATTAAKPAEAPPSATAKTTAPVSTSAAAPAGATGLCNDGTYYSGATKQGACRGHKGIKEWYGSVAAAPAKTSPNTASTSSTSPPSSAPTPNAPSKPSAASQVPAPGGGPGQVWLNTASNIYHCQGSRFYGKTKAGAYMSEAEAKAKGARPDHDKPCQ